MDAARAHGWGLSRYRNHENGTGGRTISRSAALEYARAFGVSLDFLLTGKDGPGETAVSGSIPVRYIPVISWETAAKLSEGHALQEAEIISSLPVSSSKKLSPKTIAVRVNDASMQSDRGPSFRRGDPVVFDMDERVAPGDFCIAAVEGEELPVFRKYGIREPGVIQLTPLNPDYPSFIISKEKRGKVIGRAMLRVEEL
jgi:SOS-response transcriptional repressor LexA